MNVKVRLSAMMFGQYFVWGAWWVTLGTYMNAIGFDAIIGTTYSVQGWAAIVTPLALGVLADRYLDADKLFAGLHALGAAVLVFLSTVTDSPGLFFGTALAYMCLYMPTLPLSNTIAFGALSDVKREFPAIRVLGTVGWIVAGLIVGFLALERTNGPILIAAGASLALGAFGLLLPKTPPQARLAARAGTSVAPGGAGSVGAPSLTEKLGLDVFKTVREPSFWVFIGASLLVCVPLAFYYAYTNTFLVEKGVSGAAAVQSLGQVSEIVFLLALPFFLTRFGIKRVLIVGMAAWALRYLAFAYGYDGAGAILPLLILGIVLHGVCYDFFFVAGQIYVDEKVGPAMRARAQSFLSLVTLGLGTVIGTNLANAVYVANTVSADVHEWRTIWLIPAALAAVVAVLFAFSFRERTGPVGAVPAE
jgi:nucleoside transporter